MGVVEFETCRSLVLRLAPFAIANGLDIAAAVALHRPLRGKAAACGVRGRVSEIDG